jgi:predicted molibdopterin-dependent oxidoreductase YjgC
MAAYESSGVQGRLTTPLVRIDGVLRPTTWDIALDAVARGLGRAKAAHGPDAVGMFACSKTTNELNYAAQKLMRGVIGTNNIDSCNRT